MKLPLDLSVPEIRVLQEFRRLGRDEMALEAIVAIKHPVGGGDGPAKSLVQKGYLTNEGDGAVFRLTDRARTFLAFEPKP